MDKTRPNNGPTGAREADFYRSPSMNLALGHPPIGRHESFESVNMGDILKQVLGRVALFVREFVNLLGAPRGYAKAGRIFEASRFNDALVFLGVSLVVTVRRLGYFKECRLTPAT